MSEIEKESEQCLICVCPMSCCHWRGRTRRSGEYLSQVDDDYTWTETRIKNKLAEQKSWMVAKNEFE